MLGEYIQLGEKKLIKKSKRKWAAQIENIHILSYEPHYCINEEGFLSSLSSDNLVCKWWDDGRNHRREVAISFSLPRVGSSFSQIPKGTQDSKDDGEGKDGSEVHRSVLLKNFILQALSALVVKINLLYSKEITYFEAAISWLLVFLYDPWREIPIGPKRCFTWQLQNRVRQRVAGLQSHPKGQDLLWKGSALSTGRSCCFLKFYSIILIRFLNTM